MRETAAHDARSRPLDAYASEVSTRTMRGDSSGRYLLLAGLVLLFGFGFAWIWSATMKLAFLDPEYAAWSAKQQIVSRCEMGKLLVLGDSRADAGIMPTRLSLPSSNIAVGGAKPVELYFFLQHALSCPNMPRRVILSIDAGHFNSTDTFWDRSARFGTFTAGDLHEIERVARITGDDKLFTEHRTDGFPDFLRDWLYAHSFPTLNFASMVRGGLFLRYNDNLAERQRALRSRGHSLFGTANGSDGLAEEAFQRRFAVLPLEGYFFNRMIEQMQARGIEVDFVVTPINHATAERMSPELTRTFAAFLNKTAQRHPNFHVLIAPTPSLPNRYFGDFFSHLNQAGAERFTATVNQALLSQASTRH